MNREIFRARLTGILEGLARGDIAPSLVEKILGMMDQVYGAAPGPQPYAAPVEDYSATHAPTPLPPSPAEMAKLFPPDPNRHAKGKQPRRVTKENTTPVAAAPPEDDDPENPTVVRLG